MVNGKCTEIKVSVLFFREGESWVAQALEHDIAAQGATLSAAKKSFEKTLAGQIQLDLQDEKTALLDIPPAPKMYWKMFENNNCQRIADPPPVPKDFPPCHMIDSKDWDMRICA